MKRGQISLYIIVGIVIIFVIGMIFFLRGKIITIGLESQAERAEVIPLQLRPVKESIDKCVEEVSIDGLQLIGLQGGYIDLPEDRVARGLYNEFSNSLEILPGLKTSYWFYETNNGIHTTNVPTKENIRNSLNGYVTENLDLCLTNLETFREEGYNIEFKDKIKVQSSIENEFVEILVDYPVDINFKDTGKLVRKHYAKVDFPLGKLYNLGVDILNKQNEQFYLENKTLDILSVYDDVPFAGQSFNCVPRVWLKNDIEKNLKNYVLVNVNTIKVKDSLGSVDSYYQFDINKRYNDVDTNFVFNREWPFELNVNGGEEILKEDQVIGTKNPATRFLVGLFCLNSYQFIYDIKYPVLIQLSKNDYTFQYATQVIIDNNQPRTNRRGFSNIEDQDKLFCRTIPTENTIYALNFDTGETIENADINVKCISTICELGRTSILGNEALLNAKVPGCLNAEVIASKDGFNDGISVVDTNEAGTINIELKPKYKLNLGIKVIDNGLIRNLENDEEVLIEFTNEIDSYSTVANEDINSIELISGSYDISSYLIINSKNLTLVGNEIEKCVDVPKEGVLGFLGLKERKCFSSKIEDINLDRIISGGNNFALELDKDMLSLSKKIIVYVTKNKAPQSVEELKNMFSQINENSNRPDFKTPELT